VQIAERELNELCLPLDGEVVFILDVELFSAENMWLELRIRSTSHSCEALVATAFIHGKDEEDWVVRRTASLTCLVPRFIEPLCRPKGG